MNLNPKKPLFDSPAKPPPKHPPRSGDTPLGLLLGRGFSPEIMRGILAGIFKGKGDRIQLGGLTDG